MKTKEGGVMDIQNDKDFAALPEVAKLYQVCKERDLTIAEREYLKGARDAWQAKAQAMPEGFVLMPKEPTDEIIEAMNEFDYRNDYSDMDGAYRTIVETLEKAQAVPDVVNNRKWISCADVRACRKKAMTEAAQEQAND